MGFDGNIIKTYIKDICLGLFRYHIVVPHVYVSGKIYL